MAVESLGKEGLAVAELVRIPLALVEAAVRAVLPLFPQVAGAYLFGSALDKCRPDSDIDLGIVLLPTVPEPPGFGFLGLEAEIEARLPSVEGHRFDLTILRRDQPLFSFVPISSGRLIYVRDPDAVADFVEAVSRRYGELHYRYRRVLDEVLEVKADGG